MTNKNKRGPSLFEKKGFYTALYICIALVLVSAVGISYSSLSRSGAEEAYPYPIDYSDRGSYDGDTEAKAPSVPQVDAPDDRVRAELGNTSEIVPEVGDSSTIDGQPEISKAAEEGEQSESAAQTAEDTQASAQTENEDTVPVYSNDAPPISELSKNNQNVEDVQEEEPYVESSNLTVAEEDYIDSEEILADPVFSVFTGNEDMFWPVEGNIVMDFSTDRLVYDSTLNQYRTNDELCIAADVGTQVKAAADGVVRSIADTRESGNVIVIEHGNGWFTTYSQLQDGILVEEGDVVTKGQVIGGVGEPSIYSVLLGSHLSFKVEKDQEAVNPNIVLAVR
ncbi:MAG: M23 family metallopeptidase [Clostridiales bacterium]|jgi:murein DD-endopeptidase MepM/ murein hydrolase activator NlpD|nr:M23 family metallopeptidase [Clostridiales bacterium]